MTLEEIATIRDGFEESDVAALYNGERAVRIDVFRVGDQTPSEVSAAVREMVDELNQKLPPTVRAAIWEDMSEVLDDRIQLLVKNAQLGLVLVLILLGLSLDIRLAFWVTPGHSDLDLRRPAVLSGPLTCRSTWCPYSRSLSRSASWSTTR